MKLSLKLLLCVLAMHVFQAQGQIPCVPPADLTFNVANDTFACPGDSATITINSSEPGVNYSLIDSTNAPFYSFGDTEVGNNNDLAINTGSLAAATTIYVAATQDRAAVTFQGGTEHIEIPHHSSLTGFSEMTIEFWIKLKPAATQRNIIMKGDHGFGIYVDATNKIGFWSDGNIANTFTMWQPLPENQWVHVAWTVREVTPKWFRVYINGELAGLDGTGQYANINDANTDPLRIGIDGQCMCDPLQGTIHDLRIWNTVRSPADIALYKDSCLTGNETGLVALYNFSDGTGSMQVSDITANANHGALTNMDPNTDWTDGTCETCQTILTQTADVAAGEPTFVEQPYIDSLYCPGDTLWVFADVQHPSISHIQWWWFDDGLAWWYPLTGVTTFNGGVDSAAVVGIGGTSWTMVRCDVYYCNGTIAMSQTVNVNFGSSPVNHNLNPPDTVCEGTEVTLNAGSDSTISWSGGVQNNVPFNIWQTDTFVVTAYDATCSYADTFIINVIPAPTINFPTFLDDTVCTTNGIIAIPTATPAGGTYSGPGVSATTFSPWSAGEGTHAILYTYAQGDCSAADSVQITVIDCLGLNDRPEDSHVSLYPNPTQDYLTISTDEEGLLQVKILDVTGREVGWYMMTDKQLELDVSEFAAGIYTVVSESKYSRSRSSFVKE